MAENFPELLKEPKFTGKGKQQFVHSTNIFCVFTIGQMPLKAMYTKLDK